MLSSTRFIIFLFIARLLAPAVFLLSANADSLPLIRIGGEKHNPPFEFAASDGTAAGFNVDLIRAVAEEAGFETEFHLEEGTTNVITCLNEDRVDLVPMSLFEAETNGFLFSVPFNHFYHKIITRSDRRKIGSIQELAGRRVLVQDRSRAHHYLLQNKPAAILLPVRSEIEAIRLLESGRGDAAFISYPGAWHLTNRGELNAVKLQFSKHPVLVCQDVLAVKQGRHDLMNRLNEGLALVLASGKSEQIYNDWFTDLMILEKKPKR